MRYKTSGDISPQGLPKVYVTGHSAGFDTYLKEITKDLLKFSNCAVFYDSDPEPEHPENMETFFDDLESMQLVVLVVTADFVEQDTFAFSHVFKFAQKHGIPVLPIQEGIGIEEAFNAKCGDLQMLNPHSQDITEISYEEKLKKFLDSKLIGDEMIQKIREAFDAYVFLSYRKKDRKYAQKLMRLIHSSDFCRDIAIWYDEFLVPGENFNKAIEEAMKKSELFALAVTPHLLEEGNYVMTTEYPAANAKDPLTREPAMKVMPVELVETDKQALQEKYEDIPSPISANDPERISETIRQALGLESTENNDPQHLLFIGLAYLSGIDVEVDRERAVKMITEAAEQDLPEAVDKLVSMYHDGDGVKRSCQTAIQWQKRLVELREKQYRQTGEESDARQWMEDYYLLIRYTIEIRYYREALEICKNILVDIEKIEQLFYASWGLAHLKRIWRTISFIYEMLESSWIKNVYNKEDIAIAEKRAAQSDTFEARRDLIWSYIKIGDSKANKERAAAKEWYEKALVLIEKYAAQSDDVEMQIKLSAIYRRLIYNCEMQSDLTGAKTFFKKRIAIVEKLAVQSDAVAAQRYLFDSYIGFGEFCESKGDFIAAKEYYEKSVAILEKIAEQTKSIQAQRYLSGFYQYIGSFYLSQEEIADATKWYKKALENRERLAAQSSDIAVQMELADFYRQIANKYKRQHNFAEEQKWCEKRLVIAEKMAIQSDSLEVMECLSSSYLILSSIYVKQRDLARAKVLCENNLAIAEKIASQLDSSRAQRDVAFSCSRLADICKAQGDLADAEEYYATAREIKEKLEAKK